MTLTEFRLLIPRAQLLATLTQGTYLAQRWEHQERLYLYYLPSGGAGFFVEVAYQARTVTLQVRRSFRTTTSLEDYLPYVQLPEL